MSEEPNEFEGVLPLATSSGDETVDRLMVDVDGYEGPLDVLLVLARTQKVDLRQISILALVEQYLSFMTEARRLRLELAADYLVMAAWLAYLKSRLLLPVDEEEEPSAEEMAARLAAQLARLEAMREVVATLMARDRLGRDIFRRGQPEGVQISRKTLYDVTLYELLKAYGEHSIRTRVTELKIPRVRVYSLEAALERLERLVGTAIDWMTLEHFLPEGLSDPKLRRSAKASMFVAALEVAKQGRADLQQMEAYGPLYMRARREP